MTKILSVNLTSVDPIILEVELDTGITMEFKGGAQVRRLMMRHRQNPTKFDTSQLVGLDYEADVPEPFRRLHKAFRDVTDKVPGELDSARKWLNITDHPVAIVARIHQLINEVEALLVQVVDNPE